MKMLMENEPFVANYSPVLDQQLKVLGPFTSGFSVFLVVAHEVLGKQIKVSSNQSCISQAAGEERSVHFILR